MSYASDVLSFAPLSYNQCDDNGTPVDDGSTPLSWSASLSAFQQPPLVDGGVYSYGMAGFDYISTFDTYFATSSYTVKCWVDLDMMPDGLTGDWCLWEHGTLDDARLYITASGTLMFTSFNEWFEVTCPDLSDGPHMVVVRFNPFGEFSISVDGVRLDDGTLTTNAYPAETYNAQWWGAQSFGSQGIVGFVDELAIFDYDLGETNVNYLYNSGAPSGPVNVNRALSGSGQGAGSVVHRKGVSRARVHSGQAVGTVTHRQGKVRVMTQSGQAIGTLGHQKGVLRALGGGSGQATQATTRRVGRLRALLGQGQGIGSITHTVTLPPGNVNATLLGTGQGMVVIAHSKGISRALAGTGGATHTTGHVVGKLRQLAGEGTGQGATSYQKGVSRTLDGLAQATVQTDHAKGVTRILLGSGVGVTDILGGKGIGIPTWVKLSARPSVRAALEAKRSGFALLGARPSIEVTLEAHD